MFPYLRQRWEDRDAHTEFSFQDIEGFPYQKWQELKQAYSEAEAWFTGYQLDELDRNKNEKYPVKVNPIVGTVMKHAYMLFGEPQDDGRPQVYPKLVAYTDEQKELVSSGEDALNMVWAQNGGRALLMEAGILSNLYGGAVIRVRWNPQNSDKYNPYSGVKLEVIPTPNFYGIPYPGEFYRLQHAWIITKIEQVQAESYGYPAGDLEDLWFVEEWTENTFSQKINGEYITEQVGRVNRPLAGRNQFERVPIVYIPHMRVGTFFGINTFDHLKGLVKEINLRYADFGDAVNDDSHVPLAMRNVSGNPNFVDIGSSLKVINLGSTVAGLGDTGEPDLFEVTKANKASNAMQLLTDTLYEQYRRDAAHPSVADGEDEGSQRSGLTIAMRFWPLSSHVSTERYFWTPALNQINRMILKILAVKNKGDITEEHLGLGIKQKWAPLLPRDREADVMEWQTRMQENIGSMRTILEKTGDIDDVEEEMELIFEEMERTLELEAKINKKYGMDQFGQQNPQVEGDERGEEGRNDGS